MCGVVHGDCFKINFAITVRHPDRFAKSALSVCFDRKTCTGGAVVMAILSGTKSNTDGFERGGLRESRIGSINQFINMSTFC